jgi:isopenicillin-N epimerase
VGGLLPGGWPEVMRRNRELALTARRLLCEALAVPLPAPDAMIGSLASIPLPDAQIAGRAAILHGLDAMRDELLREFQIEVPVFPWPAPPRRVLRVSAQLYNALPDYAKLAEAVKVLLGRSSV